MAQVARLFARGTLFTHTAKHLTPEQIKEVSDIMETVWNQSDLQNGKYEFCMALSRTIGNEYKNSDAGLTEVWFVLWKATVDALFHRPKKILKLMLEGTCAVCHNQDISQVRPGEIRVNGSDCSQCGGIRIVVDDNFICMDIDAAEKFYTENTGLAAPARDRTVVTNPFVRKKYYQTMLFNYLRQIIKENTYTTATHTSNVVGPADQVTVDIITTILNRSNIEFSVYGHSINTDTSMLPLDIVQQISNIRSTMEPHSITIEIDETKLTVKSSGSVPIISRDIVQKVRVKQLSFDRPADDEEGASAQQDQLHVEASTAENVVNYDDVDWSDAMSVVRSRLPIDAQKIYDLILHQPSEYTDKFGTGVVKRAHAAKYFGISNKEINRLWNIIELQMRAICLTPDF